MTIEFSDKPLDLLKNYTKTIEDVVPGIYLGVIVDRVDDGGYASVKVKIPQLDGDIPDADAPSAIVMYGYAGIGYGINYPLTIGEPVIVGVLVEVGVRIILGRFYTEGALPDLFSDASDGRANKIIGLKTPSGFNFNIVDKDEDGEINVSTPNGYRIVVRTDKKIEGSDNHSVTDNRGILIETPAGNKIEINEDADEESERALNIEMDGDINIRAMYGMSVKLEPSEEEEITPDAPARNLIIEAKSIDTNNDTYSAKMELDTKGNVSVNADGDITLEKDNGVIQIREVEETGKTEILLRADEIVLDADVGVSQGKNLTVYNAGVPIIINEHTHTVTVITNTPPPTSHTHLTNVTSPTP